MMRHFDKTLTLIRIALLGAILSVSPASAHVGNHPSIHDTMSGIIARFEQTISADSLKTIGPDDVLARLTETERDILATEYLTFTVDQPVTVSIFRAVGQRVPPYWLVESGFVLTELEAGLTDREFEVWQKDFDAGDIGLGIHGFAANGQHYFVVLSSRQNDAAGSSSDIGVSNMYPGFYTLSTLTVGNVAYSDYDYYRIEKAPESLAGDLMIVGPARRNKDSRLTRLFRLTDYPATEQPDQVVLTWSEDPRSTQTIQWRTNTNVPDGFARYRPLYGDDTAWTDVLAGRTILRDKFLLNDKENHRFTVVLRGLEPSAQYEYMVGNPASDRWSESAVFSTAPDETGPFSFIYMGDAQNGLDTWGQLANSAFRDYSEAKFWVMAGDLVNRGNDRDDWDSFFHNSDGIFDRRQLVPTMGNHEYSGGSPWMYIRLLALPENGPVTVPPEHGYALRYSNALFLILDSNLPPEKQTAWIEQQLSSTDAVWKFLVFHHPLYSSHPRRDNVELRAIWGEIFDRYHVDMALQGHDHAYLRTYPMYDEKRVDSPAEGTIYIVSNSGTKMYGQDDRFYTEVGFTNVSTFQVLDITIDGDRLEYRTYDHDGELRDEFIIEK
jgi:acid phosphatase type 7